MKQTILDEKISRIYDLSEKIKNIEKKISEEPTNIALKIQMVDTINEYEDLTKDTIQLLDEHINQEKLLSNVCIFQYRQLRKRLTA